MLNYRITLIALSLSLAGAATAQASDLLEVYQAARQQDPTFASAKATYEANLEKYPQAKSVLLPQVSLSANTTWNQVNSDPFSGSSSTSRYNSNGIGVTAKQSLYNGENDATVAQGRLTVDLAEVQLKAAKQELILRTAQAYFDALTAQDNVFYIQQQKRAISQQLAQAQKSFEVGTATITDTNEAQARFDQTTAQEIAAQNDLNVKLEALRQLTGGPLTPLATLKNTAALQLSGANDAWQQQAQESGLDIQAKQIQKSITAEDIRKNKAANYPTVDLVANVGKNTTHGSSQPGESRYNNIGIQLTIPLYTGGGLSSKSRESVSRDEAARQDVETARRNAILGANSAYLGVSSGAAQVKALEQALVSADSVLKSTQLGQEVGVRTNLDVLNAQQSYYSAQKDLSAARYAYLLSYLKLKAVAGKLDETDLQEINQRLGQ